MSCRYKRILAEIRHIENNHHLFGQHFIVNADPGLSVLTGTMFGN